MHSIPNLDLFRSRHGVEMHTGHPIMVQHDGSQHLGTGAGTVLEMFDRHLLHFIPPILRFLPHLLPVCGSIPSLFLEELHTESHIAKWSYVVVWHEVDDLEG